MPGFKILTSGLARQTARLPEVKIIIPEKFPATNTIESIQCGIVYGLSDAVDGMLGRMAQILGKETKVLVTGGDANTIIKHIKTPMQLEPNLVFHGLHILAKRFHLVTDD